MENKTDVLPLSANERSLQLFKKYLLYIIIIVLAYTVKYKDDKCDKKDEEMKDHLKADVKDKATDAAEWKKTNDTQNEILKNVLDKFQPQSSKHD